MSTKILSLLAGIFQQTTLVLIIRYSKTIHVAKDADPDTPPYLTSVAVASAEVIKNFLSCFLETMNRHRSSGEQTIIFSVVKQMTKKLATRDGTKLIPVAILYLIQNNLLFVALSNISVPVYQITNQGKLITTALISRVLLKKQITTMQYIAISLLGLGLCIANLSQYGVSISSSDSRIFDEILSTKSGQNPWLGISAVLISCITSAFAGVYFEYVVKKQNATQSKDQKENESIHSRNFQLSCWSFFFAVMTIFYSDRDVVFEYGMFHKFDGVVVLTIISQAMTGFVVSLMIAYASAILKGFAISIAALLATVLSVFIFDTELSSGFLVGAALVGFSTRLYLRYDDVPTNDDQSKKTVDIRQAIVRCRVFSGKFQKVYLMCIVMITIWSLGINYYLVTNDYLVSIPFNATNVSLLDSDENYTAHAQDKNFSFWNSATNKTFMLPTDTKYITNELKPGNVNWRKGARYLRNTVDILEHGKKGNCGSSLDVVAWLMDKVNERDGVLMLAYGELIHLHREKDFVLEDGKYIDDDFDFWAPVQTMKILSELEPEMFDRFGFTLRFFVNDRGYIVFAQILASCGLLNLKVGKVKSSQPGIEIYPLVFKDEEGSTLIDLWQGNEFSSDLMYPPKHIQFVSTGLANGTSIMLSLHLPNAELDIMTCLYGNWTTPSDKHADQQVKC